ncbi:type II toxin-antitoxin system HigB family toxin [Falsiroseomonas tokyonensis]|uniref:Type II toxin-antitoxin system HigB family toxin n=1 Tax=Falsiroseomonas tokyonensis TaxID=430521 RepID=A0ABV7C2E9_9PROT|nr:type II toxin-antitoxin system HigB family toxin [Falsiroseomonas tokyonensis]MBU8541991.1 type II toxin-antitoxin system HigB family toxin [Falsiroseomonas tokyonensis]
MRIISRSTLLAFHEGRPERVDARAALEAWYREAKKASWSTSADVKAQYRSASILKGGRVVFNICGNKYRLVVRVNYGVGVVYVRFIGTHSEYDNIDAETT